MDFSIKGPGGGPRFSRQQLPERRRPKQEHPAPRPGARSSGMDWTENLDAAEHLRAVSASVNHAIEATETAVAWVGAAAAGLEEALAHLTAMQGALEDFLKDSGIGSEAEWNRLRERWLKHCRAIDAVGQKTRFGSVALLDGSLGCRAAVFGAGLTLVTAGQSVKSSPAEGYRVIIRQEPTRCVLIGESPLDDAAIAKGIHLAVWESGRRAETTTRPGQGVRDVTQALGDAARAAALPVSILPGPGGRLMVQHARLGSAYRLLGESSAPGILSRSDGTPLEIANGRDVAGTIGGEPATGRGAILTGDPYNRRTAGLALQYLPPSNPAPGWKTGEIEAGRVIVAQHRLHLRWDEPDSTPVSLCLDPVHSAALGRGEDGDGGLAALADIPSLPRERSDLAARVIRRATDHVRDILIQVQHAQRQALPGHMARLGVHAQNLAAAGSAITAPQVALDAARVLARGLGAEAASLGAFRRGLSPAALLRLLDGNAPLEERSRLN